MSRILYFVTACSIAWLSFHFQAVDYEIAETLLQKGLVLERDFHFYSQEKYLNVKENLDICTNYLKLGRDERLAWIKARVTVTDNQAIAGKDIKLMEILGLVGGMIVDSSQYQGKGHCNFFLILISDNYIENVHVRSIGIRNLSLDTSKYYNSLSFIQNETWQNPANVEAFFIPYENLWQIVLVSMVDIAEGTKLFLKNGPEPVKKPPHSIYEIEFKKDVIEPVDPDRHYSYLDFERVFHVEPLHSIIVSPTIQEMLENHSIEEELEKLDLDDKETVTSNQMYIEHYMTLDHEKIITDLFYIKWVSATVGFGVFTRQNVNRGDIIGVYGGEVVEQPEDRDYIWGYPTDTIDSKTVELGVDGRTKGNYLRFINSNGRLSNCKPYYIPYNNVWQIIYIATQDLNVDDELTVDYGSGYFTTRGYPYPKPQNFADFPDSLYSESPADIYRHYSYENFHLFNITASLQLEADESVNFDLDSINVLDSAYYKSEKKLIDTDIENSMSFFNRTAQEQMTIDDSRFYIKWVSKEIGYGLFAKESLPEGLILGSLTGEIVQSSSFSPWSFSYTHSSDPSKYKINADRVGNYMRFINDDSDSNCTPHRVPFKNRWHILIVATEALEKDSQILINYQTLGYDSLPNRAKDL
jgi:hypothetical protein